ncbi:oxidoreductase [Amycolatopsis umgeniensis]|uniref:NAD(P)-dependent dehydrogenase (Short-subunit alcohol dehydrogenase family) n=1 Tax=Amycolatopsis umgeniensis TaxID=336628 RepID=A0A841B7K5_9PSEU|nr:oxidoreductase [Amycolatopsis umgeniensis]MBB5856929.1 NAD(P)-dependent dehydrogenase (short-subunit alcohol dehydrogenase family) [Amycolatopsis umgeniensis]
MKVALVTGASAGIGEATALALQEAGYTVYGAARRVERMAGLAERGIKILEMDVTDDASMVAGVERIIEESGRIDVLVNNAGYGSYGAFEDVPLSEGKYQFEVNLFGLARLVQLTTPHMRAQGSGKIVNVSSIGGKIYEPLGGWYHSTKFAVEGLSDSLRLELKPFGVDVVVIEPGAIKTEWGGIAVENLLKTSGDTAYAPQAKALAKFFGQAERGSHPKVIADVIVKAVRARRPKTRYAAGLGAKPILFVRRVLPDRAFDALFLGALRRFA